MSRRRRTDGVSESGISEGAQPPQPMRVMLGGVERPSHAQLMVMIDSLSGARLVGRRKLMGLHWWVLVMLYKECNGGRNGGRGLSVSTLIKELNRRRRMLENGA